MGIVIRIPFWLSIIIYTLREKTTLSIINYQNDFDNRYVQTQKRTKSTPKKVELPRTDMFVPRRQMCITRLAPIEKWYYVVYEYS